MTDQHTGMTMLEELARAVHGALSRADVMRYLDMPSDTADRVAQAILPIITREIDRAKAEGWNAAERKVVEWLRGGAGLNTQSLDRSSKVLFLRGLHSHADAIERGEHLK